MPTYRIIYLPPDAYDAFQDLQRRILAHQMEPEAARAEAEAILAPYVTHMPGQWDQTIIERQEPKAYSFLGESN